MTRRPRLRIATVRFLVRADVVTVIRIGYLGANVWQAPRRRHAITNARRSGYTKIQHLRIV